MAEVPDGGEAVTVTGLGARGDGVTERGVFVAGALPGERVWVAPQERGRATLLTVEAAADDRVAPFCPYFGTCGGCSVQHMGAPLYAAWKGGILERALAAAGIAAPLEPLRDTHGLGRRRVTLHARFGEGQAAVGYMAARSHGLVAIERCPVAEPAIEEAAPRVARALAGVLARSAKPLDLQVTLTETGLDVDLRGHGPLTERGRQALVAAADRLDLARLSLHGEVLVERRPPRLTIGRASLVPPPGGFLQATAAGEAALAALVLEACGGARRVADLFSGSGAFALRLAERAEVRAVESDDRALAALARAAKGAPGLRPVTPERRDLFRRPLLAPELAGLDAVVMDPPRAGAEAQARQLAACAVPVVASVSCDPGTFARDAAILIQGGYRLERVVPVDQFKWTPHLELVGVFRKDPRRRR